MVWKIVEDEKTVSGRDHRIYDHIVVKNKLEFYLKCKWEVIGGHLSKIVA